MDVVLEMEKMRFFMVESLTWVKKEVNNRISQLPDKYFLHSKETMLIFRRRDEKGKNFAFNMHHQRNSDVYFGFRRYGMPGVLEKVTRSNCVC